MINKKDYEGIAAALHEAQAGNAVINGLAAFFASRDPKFSTAQFRSVCITDKRSPEGKRREQTRQMAGDQHSESDGIEIDGDAALSEGDDNGTYVAAWLWVDFAGTKFCKGEDNSHEFCESGCPVFDKEGGAPPVGAER